MAKHAAPEVEDTAPAPTQAEPKRSKNYPIIVEQALAYHMLEVFDHVERSRRVCKELEQVVHDQLGLDVTARILQLTPANHPSPEHGEMETYDYAILGLFFTNVTRAELESYCAKLLEYFEIRTHHVFTHPDYKLPNPHFEVPTADTIRAMTREAEDLRNRTKKFLAADGTIDPAAVKKATNDLRESVGASLSETSEDSPAPVGATADEGDKDKPAKGSLDAREMF